MEMEMEIEMSKVLENLVSYPGIKFEEKTHITNNINKEYLGDFKSIPHLNLPKDKVAVDILTDVDANKPTHMILNILNTCATNLDSNEHSNMLAEEYKKTLNI